MLCVSFVADVLARLTWRCGPGRVEGTERLTTPGGGSVAAVVTPAPCGATARRRTAQMKADDCAVCAAPLPPPSLRVPDVVVDASLLPASPAEARAVPRGELALARCPTCGLIRNLAFDPDLVRYEPEYNASQWASPAFRRFAEDLARDLVDRYDLDGGRVLEVGCGRGELLAVLRSAGVAVAVGVDPSFPPEAAAELPDGVSVLAEHFSPAHASLGGDAVLCRQTLEHLEDPLTLVRTLRHGFPAGSRVLYVDVPDAAAVFGGSSTWDLVYPHVNYFEQGTLVRLLVEGGFSVLSSGVTFGGQFAFAEAVPGSDAPSVPAGPGPADLAHLGRRVRQERARMSELAEAGRRVALWGAGARGVTFLDLVDEPRAVGAVVDLNPAKQGRYLPGSGHRIREPAELLEFRPDVVLLPNPVYREEVAGMLSGLGVVAELRPV